MVSFQLDDYSWQPAFSNHIKLKVKTSICITVPTVKRSTKLLSDVIFLSLPSLSFTPCFAMASVQLDEYA